MTTTERVRALLGNLKNWSWDVNPQFRIEKEDADALREYLAEDEEVTTQVSEKAHGFNRGMKA